MGVHSELFRADVASGSVRQLTDGAHGIAGWRYDRARSEEHTSELQSRLHLVCRLLLEKKKLSQIRATVLMKLTFIARNALLAYFVSSSISRDVSVTFFFNDTATTEIYTLSLHDALPISWACTASCSGPTWRRAASASSPTERTASPAGATTAPDRKSTRLNSSHGYISYAVFCLKKKNYRRSARQC